MPRYKEVQKMRDKGLTYQAIANDLGVTRQRVHQILKLELDPAYHERRRVYARERYNQKVKQSDE